MQTPWHRAKARKSQRQEKRLGQLPNSRTQPNSGRGRFLKRDARIFGNFLTEARTTDAQSYRIEKKEFQDLTKQAARQPPGCLPLMALEIDGLRLWVIREVDGEEILARLALAEIEE